MVVPVVNIKVGFDNGSGGTVHVVADLGGSLSGRAATRRRRSSVAYPPEGAGRATSGGAAGPGLRHGP